MRSRIIPTLPETVLSYNLDNERSEILSRVTEALGMKHSKIPADKAGESVGFLAGFAGFSSNGSSITDDGECVIFAGIANNRLNVILKAMRAEGLVIPLKAVVTEHNQSHTLKWLIEELTKEHEAMKSATENKAEP